MTSVDVLLQLKFSHTVIEAFAAAHDLTQLVEEPPCIPDNPI